jgi:hypothetical protein
LKEIRSFQNGQTSFKLISAVTGHYCTVDFKVNKKLTILRCSIVVGMERLDNLGLRLLFSGEGDGEQSEDSSDGNWYDKDRIEIRHGYPVRYKCLNSLHRIGIHNQENVVDAHLMQLDFEYEMVITSGSSESATENARAIEWSILWNIVQGIGLHRCDFEKQKDALAYLIANKDGKGQRFRRSQEFSPTNSSSSYILSLATGDNGDSDLNRGKAYENDNVKFTLDCDFNARGFRYYRTFLSALKGRHTSKYLFTHERFYASYLYG